MSEIIYEAPFDMSDNNFDSEFTEILFAYRDIHAMVIDTDGTIHLILLSGDELTYPQIKNQLDLKAPLDSPVFTNSIAIGSKVLTQAQLTKVLALIDAIEITD